MGTLIGGILLIQDAQAPMAEGEWGQEKARRESGGMGDQLGDCSTWVVSAPMMAIVRCRRGA
ncbi:MAG: hypothetical protein WC553_01745 [Patescibacteria group bacterium]